MIIDILTERYAYADAGTVLPFLFYILSAAVALTLRRLGQCRATKKRDPSAPGMCRILLRDAPSAAWSIFFFLLTGCLKGPIREEERSEDRAVNRNAFRGGILALLSGWILSLILYALCFLFNGSAAEILRSATDSLATAHLSLLIFSLLPLPCSDCETLLIQKGFGEKGIAFRKNGTYPFFLFTALGLLLAVIVVSVGGSVLSLSRMITAFPQIMIGG